MWNKFFHFHCVFFQCAAVWCAESCSTQLTTCDSLQALLGMACNCTRTPWYTPALGETCNFLHASIAITYRIPSQKVVLRKSAVDSHLRKSVPINSFSKSRAIHLFYAASSWTSRRLKKSDNNVACHATWPY